MPKRIPFEELPVGACFAYDVNSRTATRRKVGARATVIIPGTKTFRVEDIEVPVAIKSCPSAFGRRSKQMKLRFVDARTGKTIKLPGHDQYGNKLPKRRK